MTDKSYRNLKSMATCYRIDMRRIEEIESEAMTHEESEILRSIRNHLNGAACLCERLMKENVQSGGNP